MWLDVFFYIMPIDSMKNFLLHGVVKQCQTILLQFPAKSCERHLYIAEFSVSETDIRGIW